MIASNQSLFGNTLGLQMNMNSSNTTNTMNQPQQGGLFGQQNFNMQNQILNKPSLSFHPSSPVNKQIQTNTTGQGQVHHFVMCITNNKNNLQQFSREEMRISSKFGNNNNLMQNNQFGLQQANNNIQQPQPNQFSQGQIGNQNNGLFGNQQPSFSNIGGGNNPLGQNNNTFLGGGNLNQQNSQLKFTPSIMPSSNSLFGGAQQNQQQPLGGQQQGLSALNLGGLGLGDQNKMQQPAQGGLFSFNQNSQGSGFSLFGQQQNQQQQPLQQQTQSQPQQQQNSLFGGQNLGLQVQPQGQGGSSLFGNLGQNQQQLQQPAQGSLFSGLNNIQTNLGQQNMGQNQQAAPQQNIVNNQTGLFSVANQQTIGNNMQLGQLPQDKQGECNFLSNMPLQNTFNLDAIADQKVGNSDNSEVSRYITQDDKHQSSSAYNDFLRNKESLIHNNYWYPYVQFEKDEVPQQSSKSKWKSKSTYSKNKLITNRNLDSQSVKLSQKPSLVQSQAQQSNIPKQSQLLTSTNSIKSSMLVPITSSSKVMAGGNNGDTDKSLKVFIEQINQEINVNYDEEWNIKSLYKKILKKAKKYYPSQDINLVDPVLIIKKNSVNIDLNSAQLLKTFNIQQGEYMILVEAPDRQKVSSQYYVVSKSPNVEKKDIVVVKFNSQYNYKPSAQEILKYTQSQIREVPNFIISNQYGSVEFQQKINLQLRDLEKQVIIKQDDIEIDHNHDMGIDELEKDVPVKLTFKNYKQNLIQSKACDPSTVKNLAERLCKKFNFQIVQEFDPSIDNYKDLIVATKVEYF